MKKVLFLTLTLFLFIFGTVSLKAQVAIGKAETPHPGAVLDLKSTTQGVLFPNIVLSNDVTEFGMSGNKTAAKGMVVYSNGDAPGLYIWDGVNWNKVNTCTLPTAPTSVSIFPSASVAPNTLLTLSASTVFGATSYEWTLPDSLQIEGAIDGGDIAVRVKKTTAGSIDASKISVKAKNVCGVGPSTNAAGVITVQTIAPTHPNFTIRRTSVNRNGIVTLTCSDVGSDSYNWTFPPQFTGTTPTTTNSISLQATNDGRYAQNLFKVIAHNAYGSSANITAIGDSIIVGNCGGPPVVDSILGWNSVGLVGGGFEMSLRVLSLGTTNYSIKLPAGLSLSDISGQSFYVRFDRAGLYKGKDLVVTATNDCGTSTFSPSEDLKVVDSYGYPGPDVTLGSNTYPTWVSPFGTWMREFSKEGSPSYAHAPGNPSDTRYGYYGSANYKSACPAPWRVPNNSEMNSLTQYVISNGLIDVLNLKVLTGTWQTPGTIVDKGVRTYMWIDDVPLAVNTLVVTQSVMWREYRDSYHERLVKCVLPR